MCFHASERFHRDVFAASVRHKKHFLSRSCFRSSPRDARPRAESLTRPLAAASVRDGAERLETARGARSRPAPPVASPEHTPRNAFLGVAHRSVPAALRPSRLGRERGTTDGRLRFARRERAGARAPRGRDPRHARGAGGGVRGRRRRARRGARGRRRGPGAPRRVRGGAASAERPGRASPGADAEAHARAETESARVGPDRLDDAICSSDARPHPREHRRASGRAGGVRLLFRNTNKRSGRRKRRKNKRSALRRRGVVRHRRRRRARRRSRGGVAAWPRRRESRDADVTLGTPRRRRRRGSSAVMVHRRVPSLHCLRRRRRRTSVRAYFIREKKSQMRLRATLFVTLSFVSAAACRRSPHARRPRAAPPRRLARRREAR